MKSFSSLWLVVFAFFNNIYSAGAPCFTYEVFDHINVPGAGPALTNSAITSYPYDQIRLNHEVVLEGAPST
jgi:hypothetical protein